MQKIDVGRSPGVSWKWGTQEGAWWRGESAGDSGSDWYLFKHALPLLSKKIKLGLRSRILRW